MKISEGLQDGKQVSRHKPLLSLLDSSHPERFTLPMMIVVTLAVAVTVAVVVTVALVHLTKFLGVAFQERKKKRHPDENGKNWGLINRILFKSRHSGPI